MPQITVSTDQQLTEAYWEIQHRVSEARALQSILVLARENSQEHQVEPHLGEALHAIERALVALDDEAGTFLDTLEKGLRTLTKRNRHGVAGSACDVADTETA